MDKITNLPRLARIKDYPSNPIQMFKNTLERVKAPTMFPMNLATIDNEFGVLNRTVMYRGLIDNSWLCFVTERNSRKYQNLKENPKISMTFNFYPNAQKVEEKEVKPEAWQIRLFGAEAVELEDDYLRVLWQQEPLLAKLRSHICECGKPGNVEELDLKLQKELAIMEKEKREPEQTKTYTAFKIIPKYWDFYMSEPDTIADRVQYKQLDNGEWQAYHVDA
ncbi:pyridoxine/pyridoxamine 5'-phosphate oxidase [Musca vetustissima]|uniref:pyridoxine/pyridoxamine 5'-phosphate oxidase n=1 Tax=Musca vetustissima TaxID=27455 RepID=UPI002AB7CB33|nr:pyridoxine/pyridoxamine 5'-phosphate oxidase [Musca vetustissima]